MALPSSPNSNPISLWPLILSEIAWKGYFSCSIQKKFSGEKPPNISHHWSCYITIYSHNPVLSGHHISWTPLFKMSTTVTGINHPPVQLFVMVAQMEYSLARGLLWDRWYFVRSRRHATDFSEWGNVTGGGILVLLSCATKCRGETWHLLPQRQAAWCRRHRQSEWLTASGTAGGGEINFRLLYRKSLAVGGDQEPDDPDSRLIHCSKWRNRPWTAEGGR